MKMQQYHLCFKCQTIYERMRGGRSGSSTKQIFLKSRSQKPPHKSPA